MRNKFLLLSLAVILIFILYSGGSAFSAEKTPEQVVEEFYTWYISANEKYIKSALRIEVPPEQDNEMLNYVYACTVNRLRIDMRRGIMDYNYFLGGNDFDPEMPTPKVNKAMKISDDVSIVPIGKNPYRVVFVQKTQEGWRIIKVESPL